MEKSLVWIELPRRQCILGALPHRRLMETPKSHVKSCRKHTSLRWFWFKQEEKSRNWAQVVSITVASYLISHSALSGINSVTGHYKTRRCCCCCCCHQVTAGCYPGDLGHGSQRRASLPPTLAISFSCSWRREAAGLKSPCPNQRARQADCPHPEGICQSSCDPSVL